MVTTGSVGNSSKSAPYSRSFSTGYVHPGSETDSDDRQGIFQSKEEKKLFLAGVTIKHAAFGSAFATAAQIFANFYIFMMGCGVTTLDMLFANFPVIFGFITIGLFIYAILSNLSFSIRPFIIHQITAIIILVLVLFLFMYCIFHLHNFNPIPPLTLDGDFDGIERIRSKMTFFLEPLSTAQRAGFSLFLLVNFTISITSLHVAMILHTHLESCLKVVSNDVTEV
ncbi:unnamed protein product, partial [Mesorhabditis belari]|uniref:Uncharacterized protein n=1 Tax=Mesorhabditis belari TaxID=2138241 RepID=A0AAF3FG76_9BILA